MDLLIDNFPGVLSNHRLPIGSSIFCRNGSTVILEEDVGPLQPLRFIIKGVQKSLTLNEIHSVKIPKDTELIPVLDKNISFFPEFLYSDKDFFINVFKNADYLFKEVEIKKHKSDINFLLKTSCSGKVLSKSPHLEDSKEISAGLEVESDNEVDEKFKGFESFEQELSLSMLTMCEFLSKNFDIENIFYYYSNCLEDFYFLDWYKKLPKELLDENSSLIDWYELPEKIRVSLKDLVWIHFRELLYSKVSNKSFLKGLELKRLELLKGNKNFEASVDLKSSIFKSKNDSPLKRSLDLSDSQKVKIYDQIINGLIFISDKSNLNINFNPYISFELTNNLDFLKSSNDSKEGGLDEAFRFEPTILKWEDFNIPLTESI